MAYVSARRPKVVLFENVHRLLAPTKSDDKNTSSLAASKAHASHRVACSQGCPSPKKGGKCDAVMAKASPHVTTAGQPRLARKVIQQSVAKQKAAGKVTQKELRPRNIDHMISSLEALGYQVSYSVVNAVDFFLPQTRKRVWVRAELPDACNTQSFDWDDCLQRMKSSKPMRLDAFLD